MVQSILKNNTNVSKEQLTCLRKKTKRKPLLKLLTMNLPSSMERPKPNLREKMPLMINPSQKRKLKTLRMLMKAQKWLRPSPVKWSQRFLKRWKRRRTKTTTLCSTCWLTASCPRKQKGYLSSVVTSIKSCKVFWPNRSKSLLSTYWLRETVTSSIY